MNGLSATNSAVHVQMELNIIQFKWAQHSKKPAIHVAVQEALVSS